MEELTGDSNKRKLEKEKSGEALEEDDQTLSMATDRPLKKARFAWQVKSSSGTGTEQCITDPQTSSPDQYPVTQSLHASGTQESKLGVTTNVVMDQDDQPFQSMQIHSSSNYASENRQCKLTDISQSKSTGAMTVNVTGAESNSLDKSTKISINDPEEARPMGTVARMLLQKDDSVDCSDASGDMPQLQGSGKDPLHLSDSASLTQGLYGSVLTESESSDSDSSQSSTAAGHSLDYEGLLDNSLQDRSNSSGTHNSNWADNVPFLQKWQNQHIAKAVVDNAINKTLEELGLSPTPNFSVYIQQRRQVESEGVAEAIRARGLRPGGQQLDTARVRRMQPIVQRLTQVSENIFIQNMFVRQRQTNNPTSSGHVGSTGASTTSPCMVPGYVSQAPSDSADGSKPPPHAMVLSSALSPSTPSIVDNMAIDALEEGHINTDAATHHGNTCKSVVNDNTHKNDNSCDESDENGPCQFTNMNNLSSSEQTSKHKSCSGDCNPQENSNICELIHTSAMSTSSELSDVNVEDVPFRSQGGPSTSDILDRAISAVISEKGLTL